MSLRQYCDHRVLILSSDTSAYDAARALEANHVGSIIVQDSGQVRGIVTDRDVALRVVGRRLPPEQTRLRDIMTPEPTTAAVDGSEEEAIAAMRARHVRRVPVVDGQRVVGIVSLDDFVVSGVIEPAEAAEIIENQLMEPAALKPAGSLYPVHNPRPRREGATLPAQPWRHLERSEQTLNQFTKRLQQALGWTDPDAALRAFELVAGAIMQRLTPTEASDFMAQLPSGIEAWFRSLPKGPNLQVTRRYIEELVARDFAVDHEAARQITRRIAGSLSEFISRGQLRHLMSQLPSELTELIEPLSWSQNE